jgi:hypothetical protein
VKKLDFANSRKKTLRTRRSAFSNSPTVGGPNCFHSAAFSSLSSCQLPPRPLLVSLASGKAAVAKGPCAWSNAGLPFSSSSRNLGRFKSLIARNDRLTLALPACASPRLSKCACRPEKRWPRQSGACPEPTISRPLHRSSPGFPSCLLLPTPASPHNAH